MHKKDLRIQYKKRREQLDDSMIAELSMAIANQALQLPIWGYSFYHLFLTIQKHHEVDTEFLLHILQGKDKHIVVSKSNLTHNTLTHTLLTDNTSLTLNSWGIPEPVDGIPIPENNIEVVFIPLLAFDTYGNRVGYGKGFYDNFLTQCNPNTLKIGLSFFGPEPQIQDIVDTDIPMDYCITPHKVYNFTTK